MNAALERLGADGMSDCESDDGGSESGDPENGDSGTSARRRTARACAIPWRSARLNLWLWSLDCYIEAADKALLKLRARDHRGGRRRVRLPGGPEQSQRTHVSGLHPSAYSNDFLKKHHPGEIKSDSRGFDFTKGVPSYPYAP